MGRETPESCTDEPGTNYRFEGENWSAIRFTADAILSIVNVPRKNRKHSINPVLPVVI
jgi:hypothetical protein